MDAFRIAGASGSARSRLSMYLVIISTLLFSLPAAAVVKNNAATAPVISSPGVDMKVDTAITNDGRVFTRQAPVSTKSAADARVCVIIKMTGHPIATVKQNAAAISDQLATITNAQDRVAARIAALEHQSVADGKAGTPAASAVSHRYKRVYNGIAAYVLSNTIDELRKMPEVAEVYPDAQVEAQLVDSVPLIQANRVWQSGYSGDGMVVAVIDTGVDYNHPDLGAGFGYGHKVIGGYDYVNMDSDPMDDNGHGTHCAGIVAANGTIQGVAPSAKILAYKVLAADGSGSMSNLVAAIEKAVDPDGNPATDDGADIISMSLSAGGTGVDDPSVEAVENATQAGVLCVAAAGNTTTFIMLPNWEADYGRVCAPGCAPSALTLGATDDSDKMAYFSSRGPVWSLYHLKPDCVAPGVDIVSCARGGGSVAMSGTSMATPHAAGVAALVKSAHPNWTPEMIKAAIMQGAINLNQSYFIQGTGRIDALNAVTTPHIVTPGSISLGFDAVPDTTWQRQSTVVIRNVSTSEQTYSLSKKSPSSAITVTVSPTVITIPAGQSAEAQVTVTVDNTQLPYPSAEPFAYTCELSVTGAGKTCIVPIVFLKCAVMTINTPESVSMGSVHSSSASTTTSLMSIPSQTLRLFPGTYNVMAVLGEDTFITKEALDVRYTAEVTVGRSDALNTVQVTPRDEKGNAFSPWDGYWVWEYIPGNVAMYIEGDHTGTTYHMSNISSNYRWKWIYKKHNGIKRYVARGYIDGVNGNLQLSNDPADYNHITFRCNVPPPYTSADLVHGIMFYQRTDYGSFAGGHYGYDSTHLTSPPYLEEQYTIPQRGELWIKEYEPLIIYAPSYSNGEELSESAWLHVESPTSATLCRMGVTMSEAHHIDNGYHPVGNGPDYWLPAFYNSSSKISIDEPTDASLRLFTSQTYDFRYRIDQPVKVWRNGQLINTVLFRDGSGWNEDFGTVTADAYTVTSSVTGWYAAGAPGTSNMTAQFDLRRNDKNPPYFKRLNFVSNGIITDRMVDGAVNQIIVDVFDDRAVASVEVTCKQPDGTWSPMPVQKSGNTYVATVVAMPMNALVAVRVTATDTSGNSICIDMDPAFRYVAGGISNAKSFVDGEWTSFYGKTVTAAFADGFYIEDPNRCAGIKVLSNTPASTGELMNVSGFLKTVNGERMLSPGYVSSAGNVDALAPVFMPTLALGGGDMGLQQAVWEYRPTKPVSTLCKAQGVNNIGLLVRTCGRVTSAGSGFFYIDDGSGCLDTSGNPGVKVLTNGFAPPTVGMYVQVTGISSCYSNNTKIYRLLRTRTQDDVKSLKSAVIKGLITKTGGVVSTLIESLHPYASSTNTTWTINGPSSATKMRVHFTQLTLEYNKDFLYLKKGTGAISYTYNINTTLTDTWSPWVTTNVLKLNLTTNSSNNYYGFLVDKYESDVTTGSGPVSGVTVTLNPGGISTTTAADGTYAFAVSQPGTYTLTPSYSGMTFTPANKTVTVTDGQILAGVDFTVN